MQEQQVPHLDAPVEDGSRSAVAEIDRIVRSATIWTAAGVLAAAAGSGPLLAAGWRPAAMPVALAVLWWAGAGIAAVGLGLLVWAGCPAMGSGLRSAYRQKTSTVRFGIPLNITGLALAGLAVVLSPAVR